MRIEYLLPVTRERIAYIEERGVGQWVGDRGAIFGKRQTAENVMRDRLNKKLNGEYLVKEVYADGV